MAIDEMGGATEAGTADPPAAAPEATGVGEPTAASAPDTAATKAKAHWLVFFGLALTVLVLDQLQVGSSLYLSIALGLLLGGALGNVTDRLRLGYVVDFVDIGIGDLRWYTFNVADAAISLSIVMLIGAALIPSLAGIGERSSDG
jgi:hypothetical protein